MSIRERFTLVSSTFWSTPQGSTGYYGLLRLEDQDGQRILSYVMESGQMAKYKDGTVYELREVSNKLDADDPVDTAFQELVRLAQRVKLLEQHTDNMQREINRNDQSIDELQYDVNTLDCNLSNAKQDIRWIETDVQDIKRELP